MDAAITSSELTVDGRPVAVTEVESGLLELDLPADNIFGAPPGPALSLAHGWVALLHPLTPGMHELVLHAEGTYLGAPLDLTQNTTIVVEPGRDSAQRTILNALRVVRERFAARSVSRALSR